MVLAAAHVDAATTITSSTTAAAKAALTSAASGTASATGSANANVDTNTAVTSSSTSNGNSGSDDVSVTNTTNGNADIPAIAAGQADISIKGADVRSLGGVDMSISSTAQVRSNTDFELYARTVAYDNAELDEVKATDEKVEVTFMRPAKLFGFIPTHVKERVEVEVDADGEAEVSVDKSWWAFLAADNLKSGDLEARIESNLNSRGSLAAAGSTSLSAETKAEILADIKASVDAVYGVSTSLRY
jgi:hypothetical protein